MRYEGGCFRGVDFLSECLPEFVPIDEEPNHQIMHTLRFGEADGASYQPLDPSSQVDVFALNFLRVFLANRVLFRLHMPFVGTPPIGRDFFQMTLLSP